jgi:tripartite-type tricarboxylate transporter receptor subunit TctC
MLHVPFTGRTRGGGAPRRAGAGALHGPLVGDGPLKGGKVRVLATWGETRHPALPDVPTLKELGYEAQFTQWTGLFVPAGTPDAVIAKLREAARVAVDDANFKAALAKVETPVQYLDQPQFSRSGTRRRQARRRGEEDRQV